MITEESLQRIFQSLIEMYENPDIWEIISSISAVVGIAIAALSLVVTCYSLRAQNKQSLFQKRVDVYMPCLTFLNSVNEISKLLKEAKIRFRKNYPSSAYTEFMAITSVGFFKDVQETINDLDDERYKYNFFERLSELESITEKITLLFEGKHAKMLQDFIRNYRDTITKMYKYEIVLKRIEKDVYNIKKIQPSISQKQMHDFYREPKLRRELSESINKLLKSKGMLMKDDTLNKIRKQITLWRDNKCFLMKMH